MCQTSVTRQALRHNVRRSRRALYFDSSHFDLSGKNDDLAILYVYGYVIEISAWVAEKKDASRFKNIHTTLCVSRRSRDARDLL